MTTEVSYRFQRIPETQQTVTFVMAMTDWLKRGKYYCYQQHLLYCGMNKIEWH